MKVPNLVCFNVNLYNNSKVLQGGVLSAFMLVSALALVQALNEKGVVLG